MTRATDFDDVLAGAVVTGPSRTGTRLDGWWARASTGPHRHLWRWVGPIAVTVLAAVLRLWNLGHPSTLVFDETYYVKDAFTLMNLGYESQWPDDADASFNAGNVDIFTNQAAYVAHPPLGKWIISLGMQVFGADDPVGWRISTAIVGVLAVALVCLLAFALFRSTLLATIAGGLMAVDGLAIVMSRTALLDNSLLLFTLLGFGFVLLDRRQSAARLTAWMARRTGAGRGTEWGPSLWWRPWLMTAGLMFGLATAVKVSGIFFLAAFAIYTLLVDAAARRRAGVQFWASSTVFRQAPATFLLIVPIAAAAYLASWTGWFVTAGGYNRNWAETASGTVSWIPTVLQSFWHYQVSVYNTNIDQQSPHGYQANPLSWLAMIRPTAFYYRGSEAGENGCAFSTCAEAVTTVANPILWWVSVAATLYLVYRVIRRRQFRQTEWQVGLILTGVAAGYLPWLHYTERTVFQFYTIVFLPYLILGLTFVLGLILGRPTDATWRRLSGIRLVAVLLGFVVLVSAFYWSAWTGLQVPSLYQQLHYWLPTWR